MVVTEENGEKVDFLLVFMNRKRMVELMRCYLLSTQTKRKHILSRPIALSPVSSNEFNRQNCQIKQMFLNHDRSIQKPNKKHFSLKLCMLLYFLVAQTFQQAFACFSGSSEAIDG